MILDLFAVWVEMQWKRRRRDIFGKGRLEDKARGGDFASIGGVRIAQRANVVFYWRVSANFTTMSRNSSVLAGGLSCPSL